MSDATARQRAEYTPTAEERADALFQPCPRMPSAWEIAAAIRAAENAAWERACAAVCMACRIEQPKENDLGEWRHRNLLFCAAHAIRRAWEEDRRGK